MSYNPESAGKPAVVPSMHSATPSTASAASAPVASAATPVPASASEPAKPVIGPLPTAKTITITFVPDWSQEDMKSPLRAASMCVLLGPANTLPQQALWSIEFNLFATDKLPSAVRDPNEEPIPRHERALLWYDGKPFPKFKNCIVLTKCRLPAKDELRTHSIALRSHGEERDPNALVWVRKRSGPKRRKDLSYLKVVAGHHYYLNITFAAGSTIAQLVGNQSWRPIIYLYAKRQKKGIDEIQSSRLFTNFTTNWAADTVAHVPASVAYAPVVSAPVARAPGGPAFFDELSSSQEAAAAIVKTPSVKMAALEPKPITKTAPGSDLDLAILLDMTGSMSNVITATKAKIQEIVETITKLKHCKSLRLALIGYRDHDNSSQFVTQFVVDFNDNLQLSQFKERLQSMTVDGGADNAEALGDGLGAALRLDWRKDAAKAVILFGDAPAHGLNPNEGDAGKDQHPHGCPCGERWKEQVLSYIESGIILHTVSCGNSLVAGFQYMAQQTGGQAFTMANTTKLASLITGVASRELEQIRVSREVLAIMKEDDVAKQLLDYKNEDYRASALLTKLSLRNVKVICTNEEGQLEGRTLTLMDFVGVIAFLRRTDDWAANLFPTWKGPFNRVAGLYAKDPKSQKEEQIVLPLTSVKVEVDVQKGSACEVTLIQTYENNTDRNLNVTYKFPIDRKAAVTGCVAEMDGRIIKAISMSKTKAQKDFKEALAAGKGAVMAEKQEGNTFEMSVGSLLAGTKVVVRTTYIQELKHLVSNSETSQHRLALPTTIAPPYVPERAQNDLQIIKPKPASASHASYGLTVSMNIEMAHPLRSIISPSHEILATIDPHNNKRATLTLAGEATALDRDLIIDFNTEQYAVRPARSFVLEKFEPKTLKTAVVSAASDSKTKADDLVWGKVTFRPVFNGATNKWIIDAPASLAFASPSPASAPALASSAAVSLSPVAAKSPMKLDSRSVDEAQKLAVSRIDSKADAERGNLQLVILFDRSASTSPDAIKRFEEAIQYIKTQKKFRPDAKVNVYEFASDARCVHKFGQNNNSPDFIGFETTEDPYKPSLLSQVRNNKRIGEGTQSFRLIKKVTAGATSSNPVSLILVTGGQLPRAEEVKALLTEKGSAVEFCVTGVGHTIATEGEALYALTDAVSKDSTTAIEFCHPKDSLIDSIERHIDRMSLGLRQISITPSEVTNEHGEVDTSEPLISSTSSSCIASGEAVSIHAGFKRGQKTTFKMSALSYANTKYVWDLVVDTANAVIGNGHVVSSIAGHNVIQHLEDPTVKIKGEREDLIVSLAVPMNLATKYTNLLAIDERDEATRLKAKENLATTQNVEVKPQAVKHADSTATTAATSAATASTATTRVFSGGGAEHNVSERELKAAAEALQREAEEDAEDKAQAKTMAPMLTPTNAIPVSPPTAAVMSVAEVRSRGYMPGEDTRTGASLPSSSADFIPASLATAASAGTGTGYFAAPSAASIASNFATKASSLQHSLSPMTPHLFPLQTRSDIPVEWPEVEAAINSKPLASIVLPSLESKPFNTDFPLDLLIERFVNPDESTLAQAICAIEGVARAMATDSKSPHSDVAKHLLNCFSAVSQLPGWQHVQNYIHNPQLYIERSKVQQPKPGERPGDMNSDRTLLIAECSIDDLQLKGTKLIRRFCQRIDWLLDLQRKANKPFDPEFYVKVIAADRAWAEDASSFMKEAETKVTEMLTKNPQKFHAFRELQRKGVQWPHSAALRREIERAGFVFRPMMIKRDRCVCETCGVEVAGWRPWHTPWSFHNYAKHPPSFQPGVAVTLQPPTSPFIAQMITESNMRRGGTASTSSAISSVAAHAPSTSTAAATAATSSVAATVASSTTSGVKAASTSAAASAAIAPGTAPIPTLTSFSDSHQASHGLLSGKEDDATIESPSEEATTASATGTVSKKKAKAKK